MHKITSKAIFIYCYILIMLGIPGAGYCTTFPLADVKGPETVRIALVHLDARPGDIAHNRKQIEKSISEAIAQKADWIITPELAETGYRFVKQIGTDWIENFPNQWILTLAETARRNRVALFIGIAEKDSTNGKFYNSVVVIGRDGVIHGTYRKHRVVNGPSERWATPGAGNNLFIIDGIPVGLLICADSYKPEIAGRYKQFGARILLSPANWPPGKMGPKTYWESRSAETGLPLVVNNRTGKEPGIDFSKAESALFVGGKRQFLITSPETRVLIFDWHIKNGAFSPLNGSMNLQ